MTLCVFARHVAVLAGLRLLAGAERQGAVGALAGAERAEGPFGEGGLLIRVSDYLPVAQHRQMHDMARAAQVGIADLRLMLGRDPERVLHRLLLRVRVGTVE